MKITRIYNNNVVEAKEFNRIVILQGKGLGFGKKPGDHISVHNANKVFELIDKKHYQMIREILEEIPEEYWSFCIEVQEFTEERLKIELNTNFYLSMLDHIYIAVSRVQQGIQLTSVLGWEIELYSKELYDTARAIVQMMETRFAVQFDNSEIYFISVHLLDAVSNIDSFELKDKLKELEEIIEEKVKLTFKGIINERSSDYQRFIIHVKRFVNAIYSDKNRKLSDKKFETLYFSLVKDYPKQKTCVEEISTLLQKQTGCIIGVDEKFYLLIHIIKITEG